MSIYRHKLIIICFLKQGTMYDNFTFVVTEC